jgi:hypothetical protein
LSGCRPMVVTAPSSCSFRPSLPRTISLAISGRQSNTSVARPITVSVRGLHDPPCRGHAHHSMRAASVSTRGEHAMSTRLPQ